MTASTETRLSSGQRLARGLARTAAGPVDITRGTLGLGAQSVAATVCGIRRQYRNGKLRKELHRELAAAQGVIAGLPEAFQEARVHRHASRRPWVIAGAVAATLVVGAAAFSLVRRKSRREDSQLPPSVQVEPKP